MKRVRWEQVAQLARGPLTPGRAADLVAHLGGLAPYWLADAVLRLWDEAFPGVAFAEPWRPLLPTTPGSCWTLFGLDRAEAYPLLRPALLLPVCWGRGMPHADGLPCRLRALAEGVARSTGLTGWGLRLAARDGIDQLDLSGLDFEADSAWAPLAGGLLVAVDGGRPRQDVWATGCWARYGGVDVVGALESKVALGRSWGARLFFVPAGQARPGLGNPELRPLGEGPTPREALRDYLAALDAPPGEAAPFPERAAYYLRQPAESGTAATFYRTHLLPEVTAGLAAKLRREPSACHPEHLVTVVSGSPELVLLAAGALCPRRCLLLHTDTFASTAAETAALLRDGERQVVLAPFDAGAGLASDMGAAVRSFLGSAPAGTAAFDLTPGTKLMTLTLEGLARGTWPGSWLLYLRHEVRGRRAVPGSVEPVLWRAG